jgi:hypothetical protein
MPWPPWVKSFGRVRGETSLCKLKNALHSASFRRPAATYRTPFGAVDAESSEGVTSVWIVGARSRATDEGSLAVVIIFPRGAIRLAVVCSATYRKVLLQVESVGIRVAYKCSPLLGRSSLHGIYQHRDHGAVSASTHDSEALVQRSRDSEEDAKVRGRRVARN